MPYVLVRRIRTSSHIAYDPLDESHSDIRLLTLLPRIQCSLSTHSLNEAPKYEALSYTWGILRSPNLLPVWLFVSRNQKPLRGLVSSATEI